MSDKSMMVSKKCEGLVKTMKTVIHLPNIMTLYSRRMNFKEMPSEMKVDAQSIRLDGEESLILIHLCSA